MKSILTYAFWLTVIYFIMRIVLNTYTKRKNKEVFGDSCLVFLSCYLCEFLSKRLGFPGIESQEVGKAPLVFTDNAGF